MSMFIRISPTSRPISFYMLAKITGDQNTHNTEREPSCQAVSQFLVNHRVEGHGREGERVCSVLEFKEEDWVQGRESLKTKDFQTPGNNIKEGWNQVRLCVWVHTNDLDRVQFVIRGIWGEGETKVWRKCMRQSFIGTSRSAAPSAHDGILLLLCFLEWRLIFLKEEAMPKPF